MTITRSETFQKSFLNRQRMSDLLAALVPISTAYVLALFLADSGMKYFDSWTETFTGIGIVTGLVGTNFLLIMLLLSSRLPLIDKYLGHDRALAIHGRLGKPTLYLLIAHTIFLIYGYSLAERLTIIDETVSMLSIGELLFAFVALGSLITVVVSSITSVRRKVSYPVWYIIHLLSYVAIVMSLPHQFTTSGMFAEGTFARTYWLTLFVGVLALITIFRIILPIAYSLKHQLLVTGVNRINHDAVEIIMEGHYLETLNAKGGQYFNWRFWTEGLWWDSHPYSLSSSPDGKTLKIIVRNLGDASNKLLTLPAGTKVSIEGPYGVFTGHARAKRKAVLIGAGIGITPIKALLEDKTFHEGEADVLVRAHNEDHAYKHDEIYNLCVNKKFRLKFLIGSRPANISTWLPKTEWENKLSLKILFPDIAENDVYICGPSKWTDLVELEALQCGVPTHRIHTEKFDW